MITKRGKETLCDIFIKFIAFLGSFRGGFQSHFPYHFVRLAFQTLSQERNTVEPPVRVPPKILSLGDR